MDAITPSAPDDEFDLDVRFVESDVEVEAAGVSTEDCTSDNC